MPIAGFKPDQPGPFEPNLPKIEPKPYKGILSDDNETPLQSLISYVEGSPWTVNWYGQIVNEHNDLREHDMGQNNIYQQYAKTVGLEIRVNAALDSTQNTESTLVTITGTAVIYPFLVPNIGDMFIGSVGDNYDSLFSVTDVQRKNFNLNSVYEITYVSVGYVNTESIRYKDLENKVTKTYYFLKDRLAEGLFPSVIESEYKNILDFRFEYKKIVAYYFKTFFSREFGTLVLPGQTSSVYDSYVVDYVLKTTDTFDAYEIRFVKNLNTEDDHYLEQPQFWNALLEKDPSILKHCNRKMGLALTKAFHRDALLKGIRFTKIDYIVYPTNVDRSVDTSRNQEPKSVGFSELLEAPSGASLMHELIHGTVAIQNVSKTIISPVLSSDCYVMSEKFYNDEPVDSILEALTLDFIKGKAIDNALLSEVIQSYKNWGRLEQFYYLPIVLTLIKGSVGMYY
jgi:hypothetical protein